MVGVGHAEDADVGSAHVDSDQHGGEATVNDDHSPVVWDHVGGG